MRMNSLNKFYVSECARSEECCKMVKHFFVLKITRFGLTRECNATEAPIDRRQSDRPIRSNEQRTNDGRQKDNFTNEKRLFGCSFCLFFRFTSLFETFVWLSTTRMKEWRGIKTSVANWISFLVFHISFVVRFECNSSSICFNTLNRFLNDKAEAFEYTVSLPIYLRSKW